MKICICRNLSDHTVRDTLHDFFKGISVVAKRRGDGPDETQQPNNLDDLHEACSGGEGFQCGKCACNLADMAREHNRSMTMQALKDHLPEPVKTVLKSEPV